MIKNNLKYYINEIKKKHNIRLYEEIAIMFNITRVSLNNYMQNRSQPYIHNIFYIRNVICEKLNIKKEDLPLEKLFFEE